MKMMVVEICASQLQDCMYEPLHNYAHKQPCLTRSAAVWVALGETAIDTLKLPLQVIEGLALAIINLLGVLLCADQWTIKGFLLNVEKMGTCAGRIPGAAVLAPFKFVYQTVMILSAPQEAHGFYCMERYFHDTPLCYKQNDTKCAYIRMY